MLCIPSAFTAQLLEPMLGSGFQAVRRFHPVSSKTQATDCKKEKENSKTFTKAEPVLGSKIPFLPSYIDRMMPLTTLISGEIGMQLMHGNASNQFLHQFSPYLTSCQSMPYMVQNVRMFKTNRLIKTTNPQSSSGTGISRATINESIQSLLKSYDLPTKNATVLRLGIEEGVQLAKENKSAEDSTSARTQKLLKHITFSSVVVTIILSILIFRFFKVVSVKLKSFKPAAEAGIISDIRFDDVRGVDEVKEELMDVVEYLRDPKRFTDLGAKLPKGILMVGPPGTGKTLLAKAVAGEAGVPFFYAAGSEFDEMFVGVGASRVRQLFENARAQAPSIIFIDEIDACGSARINSSVTPFARQTINQLLQEMDGFTKKDAVIVLGATNTGEALDKALTRPGRFDQQIHFILPDVRGRKEILELYISKLGDSAESSLNLDRIASLSGGMSGADLSNVVNQAALYAAKQNKSIVEQEDLEFALDKARMGPELSTRVRTENELKNTAFHEAGHALVAYHTPAAWKIYKATIRQRGQALGHVSLLPSAEDEISQSKSALLASVDVAMGGRIAEELLQGKEHVSTGAASDIETATRTAYRLVCTFGMSDKLGLMTYELESLSQETKRLVELEVKGILERSYEKAKKLLVSRDFEHKLLADALIRYETLTMAEIKILFDSRNIDAVEQSRAKDERVKTMKKREKTSSGLGGLSAPVIDYVPTSTPEVTN